MRLGPLESNDFIYQPRDSDTEFEIKATLIQVLEPSAVMFCLQSISQMVTLNYIAASGSKFPIKAKTNSKFNNKYYVKYDVS